MIVKHSGNAGDIIYALPAIRQAHRNSGEMIEMHLQINQPIQAQIEHPLQGVMLNEAMVKMLEPLLISTGFVNSVKIITKPEQCDYDLDYIRVLHLKYTGHISRWYFYAYPELTCDLSEPIVFNVNPKPTPKIVFNRTERYQNPAFDYSILRQVQNKMMFVGLENEFKLITKKLPEMSYRPVKNFHELAYHILSSELFIGNQSMAYAIAEVAKHPRILEVCHYAHNVIPTGANGWDCYNPMNLMQIIYGRNKQSPQPKRISGVV